MNFDQTYFTTATMLPQSKMGALLPRPQGDGMDSETLKIRELVPSRGLNPPSRGRQNLASSPKTATVSKIEKPHHVPHEPVKGAVKALSGVSPNKTPPPHQPSPVRQTEQRQPSPKASSHTYSKQRINSTQITQNTGRLEIQRNSKNQNVNEIYGHNKHAPKTTVKTIQVPIYNAPGHLSHNTYKMMEKQRKISEERKQPPKVPVISDADSVKITMVEGEGVSSGNGRQGAGTVTVTLEEVLEEARQVEGGTRTASMADLEKLNDEINELRRELENQTKVNSDLKKLLVASMGDDLHYKVDRLVQDKAQLAAEVGSYTKKMYQDYEDIDKLSIQADMWRSKFKASRVMTDQLTKQNTQLTQNYQSAHLALQRLLQERQQMKEWLTQTHSLLYQVKTGFDPRHTPRAPRTGPQTLLSLSQANRVLADNVKFRLLGPLMPAGEDGDDASRVDALSPAEAYAFQVLSTPVPVAPQAVAGPPAPIPYSVGEEHARFHPAANHDNLTINVCKRCKGEIQLV